MPEEQDTMQEFVIELGFDLDDTSESESDRGGDDDEYG
jgi:hypothetical protein